MTLTHTLMTIFASSLLSVSAAVACDDAQASASAVAVSTASTDDDGSTSHVFSVTSSHNVEVRIENGQMTVKLDGKEVPPERVRQEGDRIRIIDENGDEITSLNIIHGGGQWSQTIPGIDADLFVQPFAGDALLNWQRRVGAGDPAATTNPPKVMLGVHMGEPGPALEKHLKLQAGTTTMIIAVGRNLAADKAGLQPYDIIVSVDGNTPADQGTIRGLIADREPGDSLTLTVIQAGEKREIKVPLDAYDAAQLGSVEWVGETAQGFGFQLGDNQFELPDILIDPKFRVFRQPLPLRLEELGKLQDLDERIKQIAPQAEAAPLDQRIDELNNRMAQLEEMLRQLVEQRNR